MSPPNARVVAAILLTFDTAKSVHDWCGCAVYWSRPPMRAVTGLTIKTPAGPVDVPHDGTRWVVQRTDGSFDVLDFAALQDEVRP